MPDPANGYFICESDNLVEGSHCSLACNEGFISTGNSESMQCQRINVTLGTLPYAFDKTLADFVCEPQV